MRKKSQVFRTLSAFTALASIVAPTYGHAANERLPSIELNFDVLQNLKQQQQAEQKRELADKKAAAAAAAKAAIKAKKESAVAKTEKPASAKTKLAKKAPHEKHAVIAKKHDSAKPHEAAAKPAKEVKEAKTAPAPIHENNAEKVLATTAPKEIEHIEDQPKPIQPEEKPAVEIQKELEVQVLEAPAENENKTPEEPKSSTSIWQKLPFFSKKSEPEAEPVQAKEEMPSEEVPVVSKDEPKPIEITENKTEEKKGSFSSIFKKLKDKKPEVKTENEAVKDDTASAPKEIIAEQKDIYDDANIEEFIEEKVPGSIPKSKGPALNNVSSYTSHEIQKQNEIEVHRRERIQARKEAAELKIKNAASAPVPSSHPKHEEIVKKEPVKTQPEVIKAEHAPVKNEVVAQKDEPEKTKIAEAPKPTELASAPSKPKEPAAEIKSEETWQQFLLNSKKKASHLASDNASGNQLKQLDEHINSDSIVALKPATEPNKKPAANESTSPKKEPEKQIAPEKIEAKSPEAPKKEEALKVVETPKITPATPVKTEEAKPVIAKEPEPKIATNGDTPSPVLKKQDKTTLASLMDKLPNLNDKKDAVKAENTVTKKPEEAKKAPEIPAIHEVKSLPIETSVEEEKPALKNLPEEKTAEGKSIFSKVLDKKFAPTTQPAANRDVIISNNTEKKLSDTIDNKIVATKETKEAPPVPEPASMPIELATAAHEDSAEPAKEAVKEQPKIIDPIVNDKNILLSIAFDLNAITLNEADKDRLSKLVAQILNSGKRFKIVSYAQGVDGEINSARRISLQRAIAVRAQMILAGLEKNRINVQAVGNNPNNQEFTNSVNIYEVP